MGRSAIVVDYAKLQSEINVVETSETFANFTELCAAISKYDNGLQPSGCARTSKHVPRTIHPTQCYLAIKEGHVTVKTQKGKRGRVSGSSSKRITKEEKFLSNPNIVKALDAMEKDAPESFKNIIDRARKGSFKAFLTLKCSACFGWHKSAFKSCDCSLCPLLALNIAAWPKRKNSNDEEYNPLDKLLK